MFGHARIYGNTLIKSGDWDITPIQVQGSKFYLNMSNHGILKIGCVEHTIPVWLEKYREIAAKYDIIDEAIIEEHWEFIKEFARVYCPAEIKGENNEKK